MVVVTATSSEQVPQDFSQREAMRRMLQDSAKLQVTSGSLSLHSCLSNSSTVAAFPATKTTKRKPKRNMLDCIVASTVTILSLRELDRCGILALQFNWALLLCKVNTIRHARTNNFTVVSAAIRSQAISCHVYFDNFVMK